MNQQAAFSPPITLHASCAARHGAGVLLIGAPGAGKSDLLLRLLALDFRLVADDQVAITRQEGIWIAAAPQNLAGLLEVRGLGIFRMAYQPCSDLTLVVRLAPADRLPYPAHHEKLGLPVVDIPPFLPSSAHRVALALDCALGTVDQLAGAFASMRRVVLVTGLSGAGKGSTLHMLEDLGYEAVDNPPLHLLDELVTRGDRPMAIGVDARSRGFDAGAVLAARARLRLNPALRPELVFLWADETVLLRRFTETRRRHPLAPDGQVRDGIAAETAAVAPLRQEADLVLDTTHMPLNTLRAMVEQRFSGGPGAETLMTVALLSFAFPQGLPLEADLVFDARFLRNPHYDPMLRPLTGLHPEVAAFVEADPDYAHFVEKITELLSMLLPRFVQEGKKYASVAVGCTGGRHRSVHVVQNLACNLAAIRQDTPTWRISVTHRELVRERSVIRRQDRASAVSIHTGVDTPAQAQEA